MNPTRIVPGVLVLVENASCTWYHPRQKDLAQQLRPQELWGPAWRRAPDIKGDVVVVVEVDKTNNGVFLLVLHPEHGVLVTVFGLQDVVLLQEIPTP